MAIQNDIISVNEAEITLNGTKKLNELNQQIQLEKEKRAYFFLNLPEAQQHLQVHQQTQQSSKIERIGFFQKTSDFQINVSKKCEFFVFSNYMTLKTMYLSASSIISDV